MKTIAEFNFNTVQLQSDQVLQCKVINPEHAATTPAPVYISQNFEDPEYENELHIRVTNVGGKPVVLSPWPNIMDGFTSTDSLLDYSYISLDLSDFVGRDFQNRCEISLLPGTTFYDTSEFEVVRVSKKSEFMGILNELDDDLIKEKCVWLLKFKPSAKRLEQFATSHRSLEGEFMDALNFVLGQEDQLTLVIKNLVSHFRPSLRYLDLGWKNPGQSGQRLLNQATVALMRPPYFVQPPFPLNSYWLDDHNVTYISKSDEKGSYVLENELSFGISNIGLKAMTLDCREESLESPYFELVFLAGSGTGDVTQKNYLKEIQLELLDQSYGDKWTHHKMIQGPVVTWRIEPVLYNEKGDRNTSILGIEEQGTITFTLSQLKVFGTPGVSMVYLKYYNIPDFDDNQIVLLIEKKHPAGSMPGAGFEGKYLLIDNENPDKKKFITPPLKWQLSEETDARTQTIVSLGDKVGIGTDAPEQTLHVDGGALLDGNVFIGKTGSPSTLGIKFKDNGEISSSDSNHRILFRRDENKLEIREYGEILFSPGAINGQENIKMLIKADGKVGIGTNDPEKEMHVKGDAKVEGTLSIKTLESSSFIESAGNIVSRGSIVSVQAKNLQYLLGLFHDGKQASIKWTEGDFHITHRKKGGGTKLTILQNGNVGIGNTQPTNKLTVQGSADFTGNVGIGSKNPSNKLTVDGHADFTGRVGIGTNKPSAALEVDGFKNQDMEGGFWYVKKDIGPRHAGPGSFRNAISIKASHRILTNSGFFCTSDIRIKGNRTIANGSTSLHSINRLRIAEYKLKDFVQYGTKRRKGLIAQEVEKIIPDAVEITTDFIPNIYAIPESTTLDEGVLTLTIKEAHDLIDGDTLRIITKANTNRDVEISVVDAFTFSVALWEESEEKLFVYGKQVDDFRILDYDHVFTIGLSATQELSKQLDVVKKENQQLKKELSLLQKEVVSIKEHLGIKTNIPLDCT